MRLVTSFCAFVCTDLISDGTAGTPGLLSRRDILNAVNGIAKLKRKHCEWREQRHKGETKERKTKRGRGMGHFQFCVLLLKKKKKRSPERCSFAEQIFLRLLAKVELTQKLEIIWFHHIMWSSGSSCCLF